MEITKRTANWTAPVGYAGDKVCDIKATHALTHSVSNRVRTAIAVSCYLGVLSALSLHG